MEEERKTLEVFYTYNNWLKFSKEFKRKYKEENGKPLDCNVAQEITFNKLVKNVNKLQTVTNEDGTKEQKIVASQEVRLPEIEDVVTLIKLGIPDCTDDMALEKVKIFFAKEENKNVGLIGLHLVLVCLFYKDLDIISGAYKKAKEIKDKYFEQIKNTFNKKVDTDKVDTQE